MTDVNGVRVPLVVVQSASFMKIEGRDLPLEVDRAVHDRVEQGQHNHLDDHDVSQEQRPDPVPDEAVPLWRPNA